MSDNKLPPIYSKDGSHSIASLRDYFAAKAMQGLLADGMGGQYVPDELSELSYLMADAMLKARGE